MIDGMEDCFDRPFVFDPDVLEPRRGRAAIAIAPGQWFCGVNIYGQARKPQNSSSMGECITVLVVGSLLSLLSNLLHSVSVR